MFDGPKHGIVFSNYFRIITMKISGPAHALLLSLLLCLSLPAGAKASTELDERSEVTQQSMEPIYTEDWKAFDQLADRYLKGLHTTSGGTIKLTLLFVTLENYYENEFRGKNKAQARDLQAKLESDVDAWIASNKKSPNAILAKASISLAHAGYLRGSGTIDTVDPKIWPEYKALLDKARTTLLDNRKIAQNSPIWYVQMLVIARLQSSAEDAEKWLREGAERYPAYLGIYLEAMQAALPRWGGSAQAVEKVARSALEMGAGDKEDGYRVYAYVWYNAMLFEPGLQTLLKQQSVVSWPDMKRGWEARLSKYPDNWVRNGYLASACLAGDRETFKKQTSLLEDDVIPQMWPRNISFEKCQKSL